MEKNQLKVAIYKILSIVFVSLVFMSSVVGILSYMQMKKIDIKETADLNRLKLQRLETAVTQVQQFLTDASLTHDNDAIKEAEENYETGFKISNELMASIPQLREKITHFQDKYKKFYETGTLMTSTYISKGKVAGDLIMKDPKSGFDFVSVELQKETTIFGSVIEETSDLLEKEIKNFQQITIAVIIALSLSILLLLVWSIKKYFRVALTYLSGEVNNSSQKVSGAAQEISKLSYNLASAVTETSASVEETSATVKQITDQFKNANDMVFEAKKLSDLTAAKGEEGYNNLKTLTSLMSEVQKKSEQITNIVNLIDDISFQTNLLSLNASVEAARAGEEGKGFAVVAEAVRNLAQKSTNAATEIRQIINETSDVIQSCVRLTDSTNHEISGIIDQIKQIKNSNESIYSTSKEQEVGLHQIKIALDQIEKASQINSDTSERLSMAVTDTAEQATELENMCRRMDDAIAM